MAQTQHSRIQHRFGPLADISGVPLSTAEIGLAVDSNRLFVGVRVTDGGQADKNIEILTTESASVQPGIDINSQTGTVYILAYSDRDKMVEMTNSLANTIIVPLNSTVEFPIGTKIDVVQYGSGTTSITPASGVTIRSNGGLLSVASRYVAVSLIKRATDEWYLVGNLS